MMKKNWIRKWDTVEEEEESDKNNDAILKLKIRTAFKAKGIWCDDEKNWKWKWDTVEEEEENQK